MCRDWLIHKTDPFDDEKEIHTTDPSDASEAYRLTNDVYSTHGKEGNDDAKKALANHEYYVHNKLWKKEYNKEYYQKNKDYWKRRYEYEKGRVSDLSKKFDESMKTTGRDANNYGDEGELAYMQMQSAYYNYGRAINEEYNFLKRHSQDPISSFGQKTIKTGREFISNFKSGLSTIASSLSKGFNKIRSLFS